MFPAGWSQHRMTSVQAGLPTGLYAITPEQVGGWESVSESAADSRLLDEVSGCLHGGARTVQYRDKRPELIPRLALAKAIRDLCRQHAARFIVNDDLDLALDVGADGVHLGRSDLDCASARARAGAAFLIGISCYDSLPHARQAVRDGASYVAFGSAFVSSTKPHAIRAPLALYRQATRELDCPVVAIGGITPQNAPPLIDAGCHALAVISGLFDTADPGAAAREFSTLFQAQTGGNRLE